MREWDLPRQATELAAAKSVFDRHWNRIELPDGTVICRRCGLDWETYVHGC